MNMIYAKTLNPEGFDFKAYEEEFDEVLIKGRDYALNERHIEMIKYAKEDYDNGYTEAYYGNGNFRAWCDSVLPSKKDGTTYTEEEAKRIRDALKSRMAYADFTALCLGIARGEEYEMTKIRGSVQREWANMYHPKSYSEKTVEYLEALFFNTGTEVMVDDGEEEHDNVDDICGSTFYCTHDWNADAIKSEIARNEGCKPEEVRLFLFKGYRRVEDYELC